MTPAPQVAVVIPCYNHGEFLPEALASVQAQTWPVSTCIVIDDGSTEPATLTVLDQVARSGVRVLRQENRGLATARNAGVRATNEPFFVPLDADDRLRPRFVEALLAPLLLAGAQHVAFAYGHVRHCGARTDSWACPAYDPHELLMQNVSVATAVIRRAAFEAVGGYAEDMVGGYEDWDLWLAFRAASWTGVCVPEELFEYRQHHAGNSMLGRIGRNRATLLARMITHHPRLYAETLGLERDDLPVAEVLTEWLAAEELQERTRRRRYRWLRAINLVREDGELPPRHGPKRPTERLRRLGGWSGTVSGD